MVHCPLARKSIYLGSFEFSEHWQVYTYSPCRDTKMCLTNEASRADCQSICFLHIPQTIWMGLQVRKVDVKDASILCERPGGGVCDGYRFLSGIWLHCCTLAYQCIRNELFDWAYGHNWKCAFSFYYI